MYQCAHLWCVCVCFNLVFLQSDLAHLSVANKGACHLVDPLSCSHSDDVVGWDETRSLSDLPLVEQSNVAASVSHVDFFNMNILT